MYSCSFHGRRFGVTVFKPHGDCRFSHRQLDGFTLSTTTAFHRIMFGSSVGFLASRATSSQASQLPAARPLARGGVSVMAYFPVSIVRNRPFISFTTGIQCFGLGSISLRPNRSIDVIEDCTSTGAIRFDLGATVSTMMTEILAQTGMSGCNEFIPIGGMTLA